MSGNASSSSNGGEHSPKLLDRVRGEIRKRHDSLRTEESCLHWIRRFILFHGKRHPREMGAAEIEVFLCDLVVRQDVSASTQNLALSAILFLYHDVLEVKLPWLDSITCPRAMQPSCRFGRPDGDEEILRDPCVIHCRHSRESGNPAKSEG
jgi:hypothetical protein